jgi:nicotinamidase-related amidase
MLAPGVIQFLEELTNLEKVAFVGCLSEVCVKNAAITARNYFDQVNRDVEVGVYEDAIDTFEAPGHNAEEVTVQALKDMAANGVKIYERKRGNK